MSQVKLEESILKTERKLKEFSILLNQLNAQYQEILKELDLTPEQLKEFVSNPGNFSSSVWEQLQNEKKRLDENLALELSGIPDPLQTKKNLSEQGKIQKHWLFVR